ncbi:hypothetical protein ColKHC_14260 [Colletotrichum higginsianum]|nr:hypothetical protein ColKHC_14260 [Colletotrichum higginsianum]
MSHLRLMSVRKELTDETFDESRVTKYTSRGFKQVKLAEFKSNGSRIDPTLSWGRTVRTCEDRNSMAIVNNSGTYFKGKYSAILGSASKHVLSVDWQEDEDYHSPLSPEYTRATLNMYLGLQCVTVVSCKRGSPRAEPRRTAHIGDSNTERYSLVPMKAACTDGTVYVVVSISATREEDTGHQVAQIGETLVPSVSLCHLLGEDVHSLLEKFASLRCTLEVVRELTEFKQAEITCSKCAPVA